MIKLIFQILGGTAILWLADRFVPGVEFTGGTKELFLAGGFLGLINFFVKPLLNTISLPLKIITFGLFGLLLNMAIIWAVDIVFKELLIDGLLPLFLTAVIAWIVGFFLGLY